MRYSAHFNKSVVVRKGCQSPFMLYNAAKTGLLSRVII